MLIVGAFAVSITDTWYHSCSQGSHRRVWMTSLMYVNEPHRLSSSRKSPPPFLCVCVCVCVLLLLLLFCFVLVGYRYQARCRASVRNNMRPPVTVCLLLTHSDRFALIIKLRRNDTYLIQEQRELLKLQALIYDILPSATAEFSYAIGSRKLSAKEQIFFGAQTVVSLLQTTVLCCLRQLK